MKLALKILLIALFVITLGFVAWAVISGGAEIAISCSLIWGYVLLALAILSVIFTAIMGVVTNPKGLSKTILAAVLVIVVVGIAGACAWFTDITAIPNSAGGAFTDPFELMISNIGIVVTYIVAAAAVLVTIGVEIFNLIKK